MINSVDFSIQSAIDFLDKDISPLNIETVDKKYEFVFVDDNICCKNTDESIIIELNEEVKTVTVY